MKAFDLPKHPLFDCHVHLGASDTGELYYPHLTGEEYLALMDASGVRQACAFAPMREGGYREANQALALWAQSQAGRIRAFARLGGRHFPLTEPALWMLRRKVARLVRGRPDDLATPNDLNPFYGVKLLPHLDGLPNNEVFAEIARRELPILIHAGRFCSPAWIARAVLPKVRGPLILAHLGAFPCEEHMLRHAVGLARRDERVYLDTSGAWIPGFVRYAAERVPEKLLFGSDAPLAHPLVAWHHVSSIVLDERTRCRIGYENAQKLFGEP